MFLKDNKYKDVIIAVLITFTFCIIIYKAFDILGPGITYFFKEFVSLSMPFVYGIVIAYILSPVVRIFERRLKLSNGISIALTYAVFLGIIFVLCIYKCIVKISKNHSFKNILNLTTLNSSPT